MRVSLPGNCSEKNPAKFSKIPIDGEEGNIKLS
jgi:hypothetical protein